jgi:hypothetical protein
VVNGVGPSRSGAATHAMCLGRRKSSLAAHRTRRNAGQRTDAGRRPRELTETAGKPGRTESVFCGPQPLPHHASPS